MLRRKLQYLGSATLQLWTGAQNNLQMNRLRSIIRLFVEGLVQYVACRYLNQADYDPDLVENHLSNSFSMGDHNFESRFVLGQFLFFRGKMPEAARLFDQINSNAPDSFRRFGMREDNDITKRLPRASGIVEAMRERFLFLRSGSYPGSIFAHNSEVAPTIIDDLEVGSDVNFKIRFNRAGPVATDIQKGRQLLN